MAVFTLTMLGQLLESVTYNAQVNGAASDIIVANQYNAYGQVVKQTMPYATTVWNGAGSPYRPPTFDPANTVVTAYDNAGRVTSVTPPTANNAVIYSYPDDLTVKVVNGNGNSTVTRSDIFGRVVETRNYNNLNDQLDPWLRYTYDAADRLLSVDKRNGNGDGASFALSSMSYDMAGRKVAMTDMDMGSWQYTYDALGNLTKQVDARGCTTTLLYNDGLSRLTNKSYSGACGATTAPVSYGYDDITNSNKGKGKRTSMSDASGSTTWFYDDLRGRLTKETKNITGSGAFVTQWEYDTADQVISITYPDNENVTFSYLPQMIVNSVNGGAYVHSTLYDAAGRVELRKLGNDQIRTDYQYQPWTVQGGRLQRMLSGTPNGGGVTANLQNFTYTYDNNGNVQSIAAGLSGGTQTQSFTYDALDRLFTATATGGTGGLYNQSYNYYFSDGRMANGPAGTDFYNYANPAHPHAVTAVGSNSYGYDANGNMITRTVGSNTYLQSFDAENRLVGVTGATTANFVYDGDNNRVKGTVGNVTTVYVGNIYEVQGSSIKKYYYAGNQRVAMRDSGALRWLLGDHLGSTTYAVNGTVESGEVRYLPWGQNRYASGSTPTRYRYTGQREEVSLGLYYYGARWYDPALGRFIQPDTIVPNPGDAQSFDRYAYALSNPLRYVDPTGHWSEDQLNEVLGQDWQFRYFGDLAPYKGAFAGNDKLLQLLTSSETTNMFDLRMVGLAMGVGEFVSRLAGNTPDAIAIRGNFGGGAIVGVGNSFEAVVNFRSGELSYFWSPGASGGAIGGAGDDMGIALINDLPSNTAYRGYFGAVKADFKYGAGGTIEGFLGLPLPNFPDGDIFAGANGAFLGVGLGGELDLSAGFSYAFEALRVDTNGRDWGPDWRNYRPVADAGEILYQAYWGLGLLMYGDSWISANNN